MDKKNNFYILPYLIHNMKKGFGKEASMFEVYFSFNLKTKDLLTLM